MQSRTLSDLAVLLKHLPQRRLRLMGVVLAASFLQGLLDMLLVGLMARMVGLLAGVKLQDQIPGIRVFGGSLLDQAGWLIGLLIAAFWFTSIIRFGVSLMQSMRSAHLGRAQSVADSLTEAMAGLTFFSTGMRGGLEGKFQTKQRKDLAKLRY